MHLEYKDTPLDKLLAMIEKADKAGLEVSRVVMTRNEIQAIFELCKHGDMLHRPYKGEIIQHNDSISWTCRYEIRIEVNGGKRTYPLKIEGYEC